MDEQSKPSKIIAIPSKDVTISWSEEYKEHLKSRRDAALPLTLETHHDYQDGKKQGDIRMFGYMDATRHLIPTLKQIEKAKSYTAMKRELATFRKDREKFDQGMSGTFDGTKFQGPTKPSKITPIPSKDWLEEYKERLKSKRGWDFPVNLEFHHDYQDEIKQGGIRMLGYMDATRHLIPILKQIEKAKSYTAMKRELTTFRKDREKFDQGMSDTFHGTKFQGPTPD